MAAGDRRSERVPLKVGRANDRGTARRSGALGSFALDPPRRRVLDVHEDLAARVDDPDLARDLDTVFAELRDEVLRRLLGGPGAQVEAILAPIGREDALEELLPLRREA